MKIIVRKHKKCFFYHQFCRSIAYQCTVNICICKNYVCNITYMQELSAWPSAEAKLVITNIVCSNIEANLAKQRKTKHIFKQGFAIIFKAVKMQNTTLMFVSSVN